MPHMMTAQEHLIVEIFNGMEHAVSIHPGAEKDVTCPICKLVRAAIADGLPAMLQEYRDREDGAQTAARELVARTLRKMAEE